MPRKLWVILDRIMEGRSTEISSRDTLLVCDLEIYTHHPIDMIHIGSFILPFIILMGLLSEYICIYDLFSICY